MLSIICFKSRLISTQKISNDEFSNEKKLEYFRIITKNEKLTIVNKNK